jgi:signal transduction histidine kinase
MTAPRYRWWTYGRVLAVPLLLWGLVVVSLWEPVQDWLSSGEKADETILHEWLDEARGDLPAMVEDYLEQLDRVRAQVDTTDREPERKLLDTRDKLLEFLDTLGTPPTVMYSGTLPLFPTIYKMRLEFDKGLAPPIVWDSRLPSPKSDFAELTHSLGPRARIKVRYELHAYDKRQREETLRSARVRRLSLLAIFATGLAIAWMGYVHRRERDQQSLLMQEELRRQEAERRQQEAERDLLQQKLAAQEYEQKMLEMKSQLYASIGIMAGSYAHNIKNLLVRPNDLLRRCLEIDGVSQEQTRMLNEVRQTLGTVTERLQQILQTVRRDPSHSEMGRLDLRVLLRSLEQTWRDLAWERWKLQLTVEVDDRPLWVEGDLSHLQQTVENLLFNARDATFEMRLQLREQARLGENGEGAKRQALIAAASWKGNIVVRGWREQDAVLVEVRDNGIGMTEEVLQHCTETHFTTKRDNAGYEGNNTGMGLGLSFVKVVLDNHRAKLEIDSRPLQGATFRLRFQARGGGGGGGGGVGRGGGGVGGGGGGGLVG